MSELCRTLLYAVCVHLCVCVCVFVCVCMCVCVRTRCRVMMHCFGVYTLIETVFSLQPVDDTLTHTQSPTPIHTHTGWQEDGV